MSWVEIARWIMLAIALLGMVVASIIDIRARKIPNRLTLPMAVIGLVGSIWLFPYSLITKGIVALLFLVLGGLKLMGMGDVKLLIGVSLLTDFGSVCFAVILGGIFFVALQLILHFSKTKMALKIGLFSILAKNLSMAQSGRERGIPFAPYLCVGFIVGELLLIFL